MSKKSNVEKTACSLAEEKFGNMKEQRLSESSSSEDTALESFVKKPTESNLQDEFKISPLDSFLLIFLFCVICIVSIIYGVKGMMEPYVVIPIAFLSLSGFFILVKNAKKHDEESDKKYK